MISRMLIWCIKTFRPFLGYEGNCCIYPYSCTHYAIALLQKERLVKALPLIILRVLSCNPFTVLFTKLHTAVHNYRHPHSTP